MHQDLEALLALQADDDVIDRLDGRIRALGPRLAELERRPKRSRTISPPRKLPRRRTRRNIASSKVASPTTSSARSETFSISIR